ncbi:MAG: hypothetical protein [Cressdnaviricota sp.]|nr:MAG: hypothetical protein [Cressdnaviricota sp.]
MSSSFFEISGEVIELELDATERAYGRPSPTGLSSLLAMDIESPQGLSKPERHHAVAAGGSPNYESGVDEWGVRAVGSMMVRTGAAMLLIPDPLEPVSTPFAVALVIGGVALHATTW